ncbi:facilitated trehalose transporter Tret1-like isoform X2 [Diabrotica undecimpunctata]|uniref:facilitated trehalose transporter Tret1-like isoform X2 n=1 Tax=Diabrotica undecimpunctata TaxID=50387 RepID=UPI003B63F0C0
MGVNPVFLLSFSAASCITWSSTSIPKLMSNETSPFGRPIDVDESAWITSSLTLGSAVGTSIFCYLANRIGRKPTLLTSGFILLLSNILIAFGNIIEIFYIARFLSGVAVTGTIFIVPIYLMEIVHKSKRIVQSSLISISTCSGLLFSNVVGLFATITTLNLIIAVNLVLFLVLFKLSAKESEVFNKTKENFLDKKVFVEGEVELKHVKELFIEIPTKTEKDENVNLFSIYKSMALRKAFFTVNTLLILQQLTGIDVVLFYGVQLTRKLSSAITPEMAVNILGVFHLLSSFILPVIGPKFNNKTLLLISGVGMVISQLLLTIFSYLQTLYTFPVYLNLLPLILLISYIISYNSGFGALPFIFLGEMFPPNAKFLATSVTGTLYWIVAFMITKNFQLMLSLIGLYGYFLFCSFCCILGTLFSKYYLIETKNKTLEEIQMEFDK